ncbi:ABC transporter ATP-binding protein [Solemya pervernicosa gill symbiont]|uniref:ABC-type dipeptide transporter n=2 Tax=Gammaproteobacteria incertae sedis TaxID=118884 RepID=A0A1T2L0Y9_9GAMM|nr:ABC transporter ATP-binding protein [Candidatus Reidiella endopervernicosa]OOZ38775.1 ABC transporter ATP-binding protein [Solemya pervernicosa gill symbiont]QKQ26359.1 ABC transporter ATP-binding protein [Candidatus Reidiella endopervernicosa]
MSERGEPLLRVDGLQSCLETGRGTLRVVDDVSFEIARGETYALLGESGCGKSMTALSLLRLLPEPAGRIVAGRVELEGEELLGHSDAAMRKVRGNRIAMIFQEPMTSLNPVMAVGEQVAEVLRLHKGLNSAQAADQVVELLDAVGIPDPARRYKEFPHQLSGGMKQRVMIAMALAGEPDLLIADEPTTALDVTIQAQVLELLRKLQRERGMSILLITHDLGVVAENADRVGVMYAGQLVEEAGRDEFFAHPQHPYSRKLFESLPSKGKRNQPLAVIDGMVPSLDRQFNHCRFADRCPSVMDVCRGRVPEWREQAAGHSARCFLAEMGSEGASVEVELPLSKTDESVSDGSPLLATTDLKVHFPIQRGLFKRTVGHVYAVDGISLQIPKGQTLALVGESGCGKTTVGKGVLQLIRPTAGSVQFDQLELTELSSRELRQHRRNFQIVFQDPFSSMNPRMQIGDVVAEGLIAQGLVTSRTEREQRVAELLSQVGLSPEMADRYPHEFSGGQRQRICIARALAVNPKLIVCDEPTSALDVSVQAQILNLLKELQQQFGISLLFITHNLAVVGYLAHEVAVMYLGRIVEQGRVDEVLESPQHPYTQALLSAVPEVDDELRREIVRLEGELPSPANPPQGCHFHPRCPRTMTQCNDCYPTEVRLEGEHRVACHLFGEA